MRIRVVAAFALGLLVIGWSAAADAATDPVKVILCGVVEVNTITSGEGSGPGTFVLAVTSVPGAQTGIFGVGPGVPPPTIGTYVCGQFAQGAPMSSLLALLGPSDPGYVVPATARPIKICGTLQALLAPNPLSAGGGVNEGTGSATIAGQTYRLSSALPSDVGKNGIGAGVAAGKRVCLSGDAVVGTAGLLNNYQLFAADVDTCGSLSYYSRATATTGNRLALSTSAAFRVYQLAGAGSAPEDLGARSTTFSPEIVRLVGTSVAGSNTVTDYVVTRVTTCNGLPNTSTSDVEQRGQWLVLVIGLGLLAAAFVRRRRVSR